MLYCLALWPHPQDPVCNHTWLRPSLNPFFLLFLYRNGQCLFPRQDVFIYLFIYLDLQEPLRSTSLFPWGWDPCHHAIWSAYLPHRPHQGARLSSLGLVHLVPLIFQPVFLDCPMLARFDERPQILRGQNYLLTHCSGLSPWAAPLPLCPPPPLFAVVPSEVSPCLGCSVEPPYGVFMSQLASELCAVKTMCKRSYGYICLTKRHWVR